jgi:hypothetical protein
VQVISDEDRRRRLARRHLLTDDARVDSAATVADRLVALHASDPATVFISACARMNDPSIEAVESAL